jgi:hypothetical protein
MLRKTLIVAVLVSLTLPAETWGIPAFARRYKASCLMCHDPVPKLNAFGETFAGNGFRMAAGEEPRDTIGTGDPLLALASSLPIALRVDAYMQAFSRTPPPTSRLPTSSSFSPAGRSPVRSRTTCTSTCWSAGSLAASRTPS